MAKTSSKRGKRSTSKAMPPAIYWENSKKPLQILVFLLPLIIAYELGLWLVLRSDGGVITNQAHASLLTFFDWFGVPASGGLILGGVAIVVILLLWHILAREAWRIDVLALGIMAVESLLLVIPLLVVGDVIARVLAAGLNGDDLSRMSVTGKMAISIGAGLYEELMFRMLLIGLVHTILVDVWKASEGVGAAVAILASAALFTWYHPLMDAAGNPSWQKVAFFFIAGLYFGALYVLRGFGIVVAVHAFYDVVVILRET